MINKNLKEKRVLTLKRTIAIALSLAMGFTVSGVISPVENAPAGKYRFRITAKETPSSKKTKTKTITVVVK